MSGRIRVAIAGVGNCASSLVQGVEYYRNADPTEDVPGLMHVVLGGYHVGDVEFVAAFDVDADKVGLDLGKAISAGQNNTIKFANVGQLEVEVQRGPTFDGLGKYYRETVEESPGRAGRRGAGAPRHQGRRARELPAGRLRGGAALLRAGLPRRRRRLRERHPGVHRQRPRVGAEVRGGRRARSSATTSRARSAPPSPTACSPASSRTAARSIDRTYQLNFGGNMDFKNMLERTRLESKKISKTQSVTSQIEQGIESDNVHIGPSDHVPWLDDRKWAYIRLEGRNFGDVPLNIELKLEVWDSPNSAGVIIDAVRCCQARPRPRHRRPARRPVGLLHEVAARCSTTTTRPARWSERVRERR